MASRSFAVYTCSVGCGYTEKSRMWDSPPIGRDGDLRCPDCGGQVWDYLYMTRSEAQALYDLGIERVERSHML